MFSNTLGIISYTYNKSSLLLKMMLAQKVLHAGLAAAFCKCHLASVQYLTPAV